MQLKNTPDTYGLVNKLVHWLLAITIIGMIFFGWYMGDLEISPDKFKLYALHKSIGITVLALVVFRVFWRLFLGVPKSLPHHKDWEKLLSKAAHLLLYIAIFVMPLSGWLMSSAAGFPVSVFGAFTMPDLIEKNREFGKLLGSVHLLSAWTILVLVSLHVLGALKHHFIDKDETLKRMLPMAVMAGLLGGFFTFGAFGPAQANQDPTKWHIIHDKSRVAFVAAWETSKIEGIFHKFDGEIVFDKDDLENSYAKITIDMESFDTGYPERDIEIESQFWFDIENYPKATFETSSITKQETGYLAKGVLKIKDVVRPISFPFTLSNQDNHHKLMNAEVTLQRLDFNVGLGEWKKTDVIANDVKVKIDLAVTSKDKVE